LSGSASFTANQSGNTTFTVTSNATSANTASAIVARDASGNFSAGTISASFFGNITATTPTLGYTASAAAISLGGQAGPQILGQGGSGSIISFHRPGAYAVNFGLDTDNILKVGGWSMGAVAYPILHSNNYNSYAPTLTGGGASGTWGINITGSSGSTSGNSATTSQTNFSNLTINSSQVLHAGNYTTYSPAVNGNGSIKAWSRFNGVAVTRTNDYNVSTVVRTNTGRYTITLSITISLTNYSVTATSTAASTRISGYNSTQIFVETLNSAGNFVDGNEVNVHAA
jgi:hypothetical protein